MPIIKEDELSLDEVLKICSNIKNENVEVIRDNLIRPKTAEFLEKYELDDDDVVDIIHNLGESDYYSGPEEDTNPKYLHPFWIFITYILSIKVKIYIKMKIINHKRKIVVFSIHEEGRYDI